MARINIVNADNKIESNPRRAYFKLKNTGGPKGDTGAQGPQGPKGDTGAQGPAGLSASVTVGSTTTLAPGASATVTNSGDTRNAVLNFGIPTGAQGPQGVQGPKGDTGPEGAKGAKGDTGAAATVTVANTNTGAPGTNASVENVGDQYNAVLNFTIPRGDKGETGSQGPQGETGPAGQDGKDFTPTVVTELPETGENGVLYMTEKSHTTQTATGNPITATITEEAGKMESFQLDGDTAQQTYTGKNIIDVDNFGTKTDRGITGESIGGGVLWIHGTASSSGNASVVQTTNHDNEIPAGTYTGTVSITAGSAPDSCYIHINQQNGAPSINFANGASGTMTESSSGYDFRVPVTNGTAYDFKVKLMLESGSEQTTYEPYVGKVPAPNPQYPQAIQTVTGEQTIAIQSKNLLKLTEPESPTGGLTISNFETSTGTITFSGTTTANYPSISSMTDVSIPAGTYTFSIKEPLSYNLSLRTRLSDGTYPSGNFIAAGQTSKTITLSKTCVQIGVLYSVGSTGVVVPTTTISGLQLEAGSIATSFVPNPPKEFSISLDTIELCKLSTYQDYIWKDGDDWKVHKATAEYVFESASGSGANWEAATHCVYFTNQYQNTHGIKFAYYTDTTTPAPILANKFTAISFDDLYTNGKSGIALSSTRTLSIRDNSWTNETTARSAITGTTISYVLATATDTTITDQTLIAQLEAVRTALLENGANTITNTATGTNLAGDMEISYYGYTPSSQYDKWIWLDVGAAGAHYEQL